MAESSSFLCECRMKSGWITVGKRTEPCAACGRVYIGEEIKDERGVTEVRPVLVAAPSASTNTPALTALRDLYHACRRADEAGELHCEVKGEYMDAALRVLQSPGVEE